MAIETAIVLAAGHGRRIWPYNEVRNKCALPVGTVPNIRLLVDSLLETGIKRIVVVVAVNSGSIRAALLGAPGEIVFTEQVAASGTADAVLTGLVSLDPQPYLVAYGDVCTATSNLRAVKEAWEQTQPAAVALVDRLQLPRRPHDWIGAHVDGEQLRAVEGHSRDAEYRLGGIFAFDRTFVPYLRANPGFMTAVPVGGMPPPEAELAQSLQRLIEDGHAIAAIPTGDYFVDIDKPWHILEANAKYSEYTTCQPTASVIHPTARIHDGAELRGHIVLGEGSEIGNRVVVDGHAIIGKRTRVINGAILQGRAIIGDGCRVSDYCLVAGDTVIGHNCVVGHGAEMDGVQFDGSYLYHYCEIAGVVGQAVDIGAATVCGTLRFDDGAALHRIDGRREYPEWGANATYFGDFSRTGVNVITQPGVKIGVYSCVGAGIVLYDDVPSRTLRLLKQETVDRPWGPERYGW